MCQEVIIGFLYEFLGGDGFSHDWLITGFIFS